VAELCSIVVKLEVPVSHDPRQHMRVSRPIVSHRERGREFLTLGLFLQVIEGANDPRQHTFCPLGFKVR
jgi:hypothetical protein